jgi:peptidoglycan/LPS O-acetylase OafA/YrhL
VPNWLWLVPNRFGLGVHLFFLLSAFSLAHSTAITPESLKAYWIKRFFRIAPLFT